MTKMYLFHGVGMETEGDHVSKMLTVPCMKHLAWENFLRYQGFKKKAEKLKPLQNTKPIVFKA